MIKKIIHTADWHIRTYRHHGEYKEVFNQFMLDIKEEIKDYERDEIRIVIAGDLVHNKTIISNEQLIFTTWILKELEKIAPLIIISGNHDLNLNNKDRIDSISPMVQFLPEANLNFFKESKCYLDNNVVWCVYSIFEENRRPDIESARKQFGDDKCYIGLFHGPVLNAKTDIGYDIDHGAGLEIFEGCDIAMLGDIHRRQSFIHKGIPVCYSSSVIQQNFGENVKKHGFLLWDIENKTFTEHDVENKYSYYNFKITSLNDIENGIEKCTNL